MMKSATKRNRVIISIILLGLGTLILPYFVSILDLVLSGKIDISSLQALSYSDAINNLFHKQPCWLLFLVFEIALILVTIYYCVNGRDKEMKSDLYKVTDTISIPVPSGEQQHGSAWFLKNSDFDKKFGTHIVDPNQRVIKELIREGKKDFNSIESGEIPNYSGIHELYMTKDIFETCGVVIGKKDIKNKEVLYTIDHDSHLLCLGATRSGKTRCVVLETIGALALAGESMFITDVKGELTDFTRLYLERLGYKVYILDFKNPEKSDKYNLLQYIIDAAKAGDFDTVEERTDDLAAMLVPDNPRTEPIWINGERSIIKMAVLAVVLENMDHPEYQNFYNVYRFIKEMNESVEITARKRAKKLDLFMKDLERKNPNHKAVQAYATAKTGEESPKTVSSFMVSAMATLGIFATGKINAMSNKSDFDMADLGREKTALFVILPDQKETYYKVATALVSIAYEQLIQSADRQGGRLDRRVRFILDEFGNFSKINGISNIETAGGSRGILLALFLQDFAQTDAKYDRETSRILRSNCETWIYLQSDDPETLKTLSEKVGKYTCTVFGSSSSSNKYSSRSTSGSKIQRPLLYPDEIAQFKRPYSLVTSRERPAVLNAPDLSQWHFNTMFGMGDEAHNIKLRSLREKARESRNISDEIHSWGIWNTYDDNQIAYEIGELSKNNAIDPIRYRMDSAYRDSFNVAKHDENAC